MNKQSRLTGKLFVVIWCALFAMSALGASPPQPEGSPSGKNDASSGGYEPLGQHQTRECMTHRMLGGKLPPHCQASAEFENWRQDFSLTTDGWVDKTDPGPTGWCGSIERVGVEDLTGADGEIRPLSGDNYAVIRHGECNETYKEPFPEGSAPASFVRPKNDHFPEGGYVSALHVHLDPDWAEGSDFGYAEAFQVLDDEWPNFRYLFVPVERNEDGLFVGEFEVTEAGWYTFSTIFTASNSQNLSADFVLYRHGWPLYRQELDTTMISEEPVDSFDIDNVSNAYIWFTHISEGLELAIDEEQLRRPLDGFGPPGLDIGSLEDSYSGFDGQIFDIAALPNGNLLVAENAPDWSDNTMLEIGPRGIEPKASIPVSGPAIQGLEPVGQDNFFATTGGQDLARDTALWRVSGGEAELVADIESFTMGDWPEGNPGPFADTWKDFRCEEFADFAHSPQANPYHLTALSGSEMLIGDAANNGVLWVDADGNIEVVAFMEPATDPDTGDWMVLGYVNEEGEIVGVGDDADGPIECYVEPVPTSIAIGPDGAWYVGELTGTTPVNFDSEPSPRGLARIWRIEPGSRNVTCPSAECAEVEVDAELNTIVDLEFGPDGLLYLVEFEKSGFLGAVAPDLEIPLAGGAVKRCNVETGQCEKLDIGGAFLPGAITFDRWNNLWLVENVFEPTIRKIDWR